MGKIFDLIVSYSQGCYKSWLESGVGQQATEMIGEYIKSTNDVEMSGKTAASGIQTKSIKKLNNLHQHN